MKSNLSKTVRDREMVSIGIKYKVIYGLSNDIKNIDSRRPSEVKGQGQTVKMLKSISSTTVRDREMVSIEVK